jgi:hypothetical protein
MKTTLPPFSLLCAIFALFDAVARLVLLYSVACALWSLSKASRAPVMRVEFVGMKIRGCTLGR